MTSHAGRRIAALEALPAPQRARTLEDAHPTYVATAARCGFTEEQVMARFGGWPGFFYAKLILGKVVDPTAPKTDLATWPAGRNPMTAYLDMVRS